MSVINQMLRDLDKRHVNHIGTLSFENLTVPNADNGGGHHTSIRQSWLKFSFALGVFGSLILGSMLAYPKLYQTLHERQDRGWASQIAQRTGVISNANAHIKNPSTALATQLIHASIKASQMTHTSKLIAEEVEHIREQLEQENAEIVAGLNSAMAASATATHSEPNTKKRSAQTEIVSNPLQKLAAIDSITDSATHEETVAPRTLTEPKPIRNNSEANKNETSKVSIHPHSSPENMSAEAFNQALQFMQSGHTPEAQQWLTKALLASPYNHEARQTLVALLIQNKQNDEAIAVLHAGLKLDAQQIGFRQLLARLQVEIGENKAALVTLEEGLADAKDDAQYHAFMAALLQRNEHHKEAVNHYLVALKQNPQANWLVGLGMSLQALDRLSEAKMAYEKAQSSPINAELSNFVSQRLQQIHGLN